MAHFITPKITSQMKNQIQQQPMPSYDGKYVELDEPLQSTCPELVETQIPTTSVTQMYPVKDDKDEQIKLEEERSISKVSYSKYLKRKHYKKEWKMQMNAQMRRLVPPKTPLTIFSELFKDVPIQLQAHKINNNVVIGYTALLDIGGRLYTAYNISKNQAKQAVSENVLRDMLTNKIREQCVKKEESSMETGMEDGEIGTVYQPEIPPKEDFPWPHFASLAMHNLFQQWELQPFSGAILNSQDKQFNGIISPPKIGAMKKFPDDPRMYNPIQLLNQMMPGIQFIDTTISKKPITFQVKCKIDNVPFFRQGRTKKEAKANLCIAVIKHFWKFDYLEDGPRTEK